MGAAGRKAVVARFSRERLVEDIDLLYASALLEKRSPPRPRSSYNHQLS